MQSAETAANVTPAPAPSGGEGQLKQGDTVGGRFVIDERIRQGVIGATYRAVDEKSGKQIAILLLDPAMARDRETTDALRAAVKMATALSHKNLVSIFGMGKEAGRRYLAREYVDGQSLAELLDKKAAAGKRFTLKGAYNLVAHVCNALAASEGMVHGTLRPSVVLINRTGRVKVSDFGLAELRPVMVERRALLDVWDAACLQAPEHDDLFALGAMLFSLLAGRPPAVGESALPADVVDKLPEGVGPIVGQLLDPGAAGRFANADEVKAALQAAIRDGRAPAEVETPQGAALHAGASLEVLEPGRAEVIETTPLPAVPASPKAPPKPDGGFVIPDLGGGADVDDDGSLQRWLVERNGTDYGPYTRKQVVEQLFNEEITADTILFDIETDRRAGLGEFQVFDQVLVDWIHEKAAREKRRSEQAAAAAARRRNRLLGGIVAVILLGVGGGAGGWFWYQSTRPEPVPARLPRMVSVLSGALPAVNLPEELPETEAEIRERRQAKVAKRAAERARVEAAQVEREARLAASSELALGSGNGSRFNRAAFDQVVAARQGQIMACLQDEVRRDPSLKGVKVGISILPTGELINVTLAGGTGRGQSCVRRALGGLKVPAFDGTNVKVSLPYNFQR
ncbi:MAG: serine/threonine protein kinase [Myxococcales bacterium]|nr:serine/threonine protein kinase [Myxococcales bacterium]